MQEAGQRAVTCTQGDEKAVFDQQSPDQVRSQRGPDHEDVGPSLPTQAHLCFLRAASKRSQVLARREGATQDAEGVDLQCGSYRHRRAIPVVGWPKDQGAERDRDQGEVDADLDGPACCSGIPCQLCR